MIARAGGTKAIAKPAMVKHATRRKPQSLQPGNLAARSRANVWRPVMAYETAATSCGRLLNTIQQQFSAHPIALQGY
jgi:hypothetical protein